MRGEPQAMLGELPRIVPASLSIVFVASRMLSIVSTIVSIASRVLRVVLTRFSSVSTMLFVTPARVLLMKPMGFVAFMARYRAREAAKRTG
jgi:hypothetical protein